MKRVLFAIVSLVMLSQIVLAQTETKKNVATENLEKSSFDKFYERLRIGYFGAYSGSSLGQWDQTALDVGGTKDKTSGVQNLFNQVAFNYNFGAKLGFVLAPRWTMNLASTSAYDKDTNGIFSLEDFLAGFQGVIVTSEDKKFNWWLRAALRLPTSRGSRTNDITYQPDIANFLTYDFDKTWQVGAFVVYRHWVYENRYNLERYRVYAAPFVQYAIDDTSRVQVWWETMANHNGEDNKLAMKEMLQDILVGYNKDVTSKLNLFPYIGYHLNTTYAYEKPADAMFLAAWISYQIK
jgi:hypothetical protein